MQTIDIRPNSLADLRKMKTNIQKCTYYWSIGAIKTLYAHNFRDPCCYNKFDTIREHIEIFVVVDKQKTL